VVWAEWPILMQGSGCASTFCFPSPFALHLPTWRAMYMLSTKKISRTGDLIRTSAWFLDSLVKHSCGIDPVYLYHKVLMASAVFFSTALRSSKHWHHHFLAWSIWKIIIYGACFELFDKEWHGLIRDILRNLHMLQ
jgi:hypothetical protein